MSSDQMKSVANHIQSFYQKSVAENPRLLTQDHIDKIKKFLYEFCPQKMLKITKEFLPNYTIENLSKTASCVEKFIYSMPKLSTEEDILNYENLYRKDFSDHFAAGNDPILLPTGPVKSSNEFIRLHRQLLDEINEFLWHCSEIRFIFNLMRPPYGKTNNFTNKVADKINETVNEIINGLDRQQSFLLCVYEQRAEQMARVTMLPQMEDVQLKLKNGEQYCWINFQTFVRQIQQYYGTLYQLAMKNLTIMDDIFKQALIHARYDQY